MRTANPFSVFMTPRWAVNCSGLAGSSRHDVLDRRPVDAELLRHGVRPVGRMLRRVAGLDLGHLLWGQNRLMMLLPRQGSAVANLVLPVVAVGAPVQVARPVILPVVVPVQGVRPVRRGRPVKRLANQPMDVRDRLRLPVVGVQRYVRVGLRRDLQQLALLDISALDISAKTESVLVAYRLVQ